jgi:hypothetical protein
MGLLLDRAGRDWIGRGGCARGRAFERAGFFWLEGQIAEASVACEAYSFNTSNKVTESNVVKPPREAVHFWNAHCGLDQETSDLILQNMPADSAQIALERVLAAVGQCLDRQSAESLLRLRADTEMQGRIEELADKSTEGRLTPEERDEYEAMIRVGNFVAILQAKARRLLAEGHAA